MAGSTRLFPFKTLDTVAILTLASAASSFRPTLLLWEGDSFISGPWNGREEFFTSSSPIDYTASAKLQHAGISPTLGRRCRLEAERKVQSIGAIKDPSSRF